MTIVDWAWICQDWVPNQSWSGDSYKFFLRVLEHLNDDVELNTILENI